MAPKRSPGSCLRRFPEPLVLRPQLAVRWPCWSRPVAALSPTVATRLGPERPLHLSHPRCLSPAPSLETRALRALLTTPVYCSLSPNLGFPHAPTHHCHPCINVLHPSPSSWLYMSVAPGALVAVLLPQWLSSDQFSAPTCPVSMLLRAPWPRLFLSSPGERDPSHFCPPFTPPLRRTALLCTAGHFTHMAPHL